MALKLPHKASSKSCQNIVTDLDCPVLRVESDVYLRYTFRGRDVLTSPPGWGERQRPLPALAQKGPEGPDLEDPDLVDSQGGVSPSALWHRSSLLLSASSHTRNEQQSVFFEEDYVSVTLYCLCTWAQGQTLRPQTLRIICAGTGNDREQG